MACRKKHEWINKGFRVKWNSYQSEIWFEIQHRDDGPKERLQFFFYFATVCGLLIHVSCLANAGQMTIFIPRPPAVTAFILFFYPPSFLSGYFKALKKHYQQFHQSCRTIHTRPLKLFGVLYRRSFVLSVCKPIFKNSVFRFHWLQSTVSSSL